MSKAILKGKKVILRPLSLNDAPNFCKWFRDEEVTFFLARYEEGAPPTLSEERDWIKKTQRDKNQVYFSIDSIDGTHIGSVALRLNHFNKNGEFGILIGDRKYWGQGCGTEATQLIVEYGLKKMKLHRIYLYVCAFNLRAIQTYKRVGFKVEGVFRQHVYRKGDWHDKFVMGILKNEFTTKLKIKNKKQNL